MKCDPSSRCFPRDDGYKDVGWCGTEDTSIAITTALCYHLPMAQIIVRNLDNTLKAQLVMYAKQHGHSMEEEVRQILRESLAKKASGLGSRIAGRFRASGLDQEIPEFKGQPLRNPFEDA